MVCTENMFREHVPAGTVPRTSVNARIGLYAALFAESRAPENYFDLINYNHEDFSWGLLTLSSSGPRDCIKWVQGHVDTLNAGKYFDFFQNNDDLLWPTGHWVFNFPSILELMAFMCASVSFYLKSWTWRRPLLKFIWGTYIPEFMVPKSFHVWYIN